MMRFRIIFAAVAILLAVSFVGAFAHEFETGHIERTIDVVVRGRKVQVKYAVGISDSSILDLLVEQKLIDAAEEARFRKCIVELEKGSEETNSKETQTGKESDDKTKKLNPPESTAQPVLTTSPNQKPARKLTAEVSESEGATDPLKFQTELLTLLQEKLSGSIAENLELSCDGKSLEKVEIAVSNSARHHVSLEIAFSVDLPDAEKIKLSIVDYNFLDLKAPPATEKPTIGEQPAEADEDSNVAVEEFRYFGNIRLACRVKGKVVQLNSNVAPILARAKLTSVGTLNREQRIEAATIRTKLAF